ncbi:MAG TPA: DinB family protein [Anaerolineae bacterium]
MMKKTELVDRLRRSRHILLEALKGFDEEEMLKPNAVSVGSLKDLMAHLASWDAEMVRVMQAFAMQDDPKFAYSISTYNDFATWNAEQIALRADLTLKQAVREIETARSDLMQTLDGMTDPVLRRTKKTPWGRVASSYDLILTQIEHDEEHLKHILSFHKKMERWKRARLQAAARRKKK